MFGLADAIVGSFDVSSARDVVAHLTVTQRKRLRLLFLFVLNLPQIQVSDFQAVDK